MRTKLRKIRVSDSEWAAYEAAAPNGNRSAWLRALAADALAWPGELRLTVAPATTALADVELGRAPFAESAVSRGNAGVRATASDVAHEPHSGGAEPEPANRQHVADSPDVPRVIIGDPDREAFLRREAALLATLNPRED